MVNDKIRSLVRMNTLRFLINKYDADKGTNYYRVLAGEAEDYAGSTLVEYHVR